MTVVVQDVAPRDGPRLVLVGLGVVVVAAPKRPLPVLTVGSLVVLLRPLLLSKGGRLATVVGRALPALLLPPLVVPVVRVRPTPSRVNGGLDLYDRLHLVPAQVVVRVRLPTVVPFTVPNQPVVGVALLPDQSRVKVLVLALVTLLRFIAVVVVPVPPGAVLGQGRVAVHLLVVPMRAPRVPSRVYQLEAQKIMSPAVCVKETFLVVAPLPLPVTLGVRGRGRVVQMMLRRLLTRPVQPLPLLARFHRQHKWGERAAPLVTVLPNVVPVITGLRPWNLLSVVLIVQAAVAPRSIVARLPLLPLFLLVVKEKQHI